MKRREKTREDLLEKEITGAPVTVTLGGEEYTLAYPISAIILYKQKTGDNLFRRESWQKVAPVEDPERFLACLWAGLQTHHPDMSIDKLGGLVDFHNAAELNLAIARAIASYFPQNKEGADPNAMAPELAASDEQALATTTEQ
jgi:hypothetical protein